MKAPAPYHVFRGLNGRWHLSHDGERLTVRGYPHRAMAYRCAVMRDKLKLDAGPAMPLREHFLQQHLEN